MEGAERRRKMLAHQEKIGRNVMAGRPKPLNPGSSGPAVFGSMLRLYRESGGYKIVEFGAMIHNSASTISDTEHGKSRCERSLAENADRELGTGGALAHLWDLLVKGSVHPKWFDWPAYEVRANTLRHFHPSVIPGILQTEDYSRALFVASGSKDVEADVAARAHRQHILSREDPAPPLLVCVLPEVVLWNQVGSPVTMRDQLKFLVSCVSDQISVHVVPNGAAHPGVTGAFVLATLEDRSEVAYLETGARGITTGSLEDITTLSVLFERIRNKALPVDQSVDLILRTVEERWS